MLIISPTIENIYTGISVSVRLSRFWVQKKSMSSNIAIINAVDTIRSKFRYTYFTITNLFSIPILALFSGVDGMNKALFARIII